MSRLERKDWEELKRSAEARLKEAEISTLQFTTLMDIATNKLEVLKDEEIESTKKEIEKEIELDDEN